MTSPPSAPDTLPGGVGERMSKETKGIVMGQRLSFLAVVFILVATGLPTGVAADGVAVIAGKREGRTSTEPAEAAINEPFATAFDLEGGLWGVEFTRANRVFRIDPAPAGGAHSSWASAGPTWRTCRALTPRVRPSGPPAYT